MATQPRSNAAGYNIYYGTASHDYTTKVSVGNVTNTMIYGLTGGDTYFFAATTYDVLNQESGFSNEASYAVPLNITNAQPTLILLSDLVINENAPTQSIPLTGISSGTTNENQTLTVTASSSNLASDPQSNRHLYQSQHHRIHCFYSRQQCLRCGHHFCYRQ